MGLDRESTERLQEIFDKIARDQDQLNFRMLEVEGSVLAIKHVIYGLKMAMELVSPDMEDRFNELFKRSLQTPSTDDTPATRTLIESYNRTLEVFTSAIPPERGRLFTIIKGGKLQEP